MEWHGCQKSQLFLAASQERASSHPKRGEGFPMFVIQFHHIQDVMKMSFHEKNKYWYFVLKTVFLAAFCCHSTEVLFGWLFLWSFQSWVGIRDTPCRLVLAAFCWYMVWFLVVLIQVPGLIRWELVSNKCLQESATQIIGSLWRHWKISLTNMPQQLTLKLKRKHTFKFAKPNSRAPPWNPWNIHERLFCCIRLCRVGNMSKTSRFSSLQLDIPCVANRRNPKEPTRRGMHPSTNQAACFA